MNTTTVLIVVVTLFVIVLALLPSFYQNRKKKTSEEDWAVAGRSLPIYVVVGTQFASVIGGGVLVGHVGSAYQNGIAHTIYGVLMVVPFLILMVLAKWLRSNNFSTVPEIVRSFSGDSKAIGVISAIMTIFVPFGWITSQITAFGTIYSSLTGINYNVLCIVFAVISLLFIMPSGLKTVAWTDFIFACFMIFMCGVCVFVSANMAGGFSALKTSVDPSMVSFSASANKIGLSTIVLWIFAVLPGGITNQLYFQRICAIDDEKQVNKSLVLSCITSFIGFCWAVYMGITVFAINPNIADNSATGWFISQLSPPVLAGFAALIFATMMSTVSSGVQSVAVNITRDVLPVLKPDLDANSKLKISRALSLVVMIVAVLMCLVFTDTLTWLTLGYAFSAATLLCPIYMGYALRNKGIITKQGIGASMIAGVIGCVIGLILDTAVNYAAIGILLSFFTLLIVSKFTRKASTKLQPIKESI